MLCTQVENALRKELTTGIKEKYKANDQEGLREAWDNVQRKVGGLKARLLKMRRIQYAASGELIDNLITSSA